jgi:hypothetical protein
MVLAQSENTVSRVGLHTQSRMHPQQRKISVEDLLKIKVKHQEKTMSLECIPVNGSSDVEACLLCILVFS